MIKKAFTATFAVFLTANVQAEAVGLYLGGQVWQSEASGVFGEINALRDFDLAKEYQNNYFVAIEHPFPLLPNIRISSTSLATLGHIRSMQEFSNDNEVYYVDVRVDSDVEANFNVSYIDYTLYYQVFDNGLFSVDLGLSARDFNGSVTVTETTNTTTTTADKIWDEEEHDGHDHPPITETTTTVEANNKKTNDIEPMLYVASSISLPLTGVSVFAQGDFSLINDHSLYDYQLGLSYDLINNVMVDFNLTLGYRAVKMEFQDVNSLYTDLEFKGAFVGVIAHF
ncbi:TIGR04219 family outer membrane beta-barrel protein [Thalassotalea piscium]|uniref:TIGR04219 family outer membrane beta-barrel protein n=1 Tax=Thalassotalea piscium TaxID=1230533 RepID=A0A7X0TUQ6_9GAMM|nr:TIGR04219 family outer membrane beta-barrel protein [Thalassotalea piscium]MBB6544394.1 hypothetical protein [Thalassotalea piscium]